MLPFHKILFATDYSDACKAIVPHVNDLVAHYSADLALFHALDLDPVIYPEMGTIARFMPDHGLQKKEKARLEDFAAEMFPHLTAEVMIADEGPGEAIPAAIQKFGADLVMLPTQGRGRFRRLLLGSVTAKVLHDSSCAVWTGVHRPHDEYQPQLPYRSILCAIELDEEAPIIVRAAASIAKCYDAKLALLHVIQDPPIAWEVDYAPYRKALMDTADMTMRDLRHAANVQAEISVRSGSPAATIRQAVIDHQADLVVIGRGHSQEILGRMWSNLYGIVREAPCPVLSI